MPNISFRNTDGSSRIHTSEFDSDEVCATSSSKRAINEVSIQCDEDAAGAYTSNLLCSCSSPECCIDRNMNAKDIMQFMSQALSSKKDRRVIYRDILGVVVFLLIAFWASAHFNLFETIHDFSRDYDKYELDEVLIAFSLVWVAFAFFMLQRWIELRKEVSNRVAAEENLNRSEMRYRELVDRTDNLVLRVDGKGTIQFVNHKSNTVFGYPPEQCIGRHMREFLAPGEEEKVLHALADVAKSQKETDTIELAYCNNLGLITHILWSAYFCYKDDGSIETINAIGRDITDRAKLARSREELIEELQEALEKVKTLSGLLPICMHCKKIRNDDGYWERIENYITSHSGAMVSHGICPECANELYPEYSDVVKDKILPQDLTK